MAAGGSGNRQVTFFRLIDVPSVIKLRRDSHASWSPADVAGIDDGGISHRQDPR